MTWRASPVGALSCSLVLLACSSPVPDSSMAVVPEAGSGAGGSSAGGTSGRGGAGDSAAGSGLGVGVGAGASGGASDDPGGAGADAPSQDAGTDEPTFVAPRSARQACIAYFDAMYGRMVECSRGDPLPKETAAMRFADCPDALFADGSTYTIDSAFECAEAWQSFSCLDLASGLQPSCVKAGAREAGTACVFHAQCASQQCLGAGPTPSCRTCLALVREGEPCDAFTQACEPGSVCDGGLCKTVAMSLPVAAGEPCDRDEQCPSMTQRCVDAPGGSLRCQEAPVEGEPCATLTVAGFHVCGRGLRCSAQGRCQSAPDAGQPCLHDADTGFIECAEGSFCDAADACVSLPAAGEECATSEDLRGLRCEPSARCESAMCVPRLPLGSSCDTRVADWMGNCVAGATCHCEDPACMQPGTCLRVLEEGAPCTAPNTVCASGTECRDGVCTAVDSLGIAEDTDRACTPSTP